MFDYFKNNKVLTIVGSMALAAVVAAPAMAQRDPAYAAARASGAIGEKPDGYLGFVKPPSAAIKALVGDLNIRRKQAYTRKAQATNSTVEQFAFSSGCNLIARTVAGEKYQTPNGSWMTRSSAAPLRNPSCI